MNGKRPSKDVLLCLLKVFDVPQADRAAWQETWLRLAEMPSAGPIPRFDEVSPRQLGIHAAISAKESIGELPEYVSRDFDDDLREHVSAGIDRGCFVLLLGRSSSGKTRSLYEAVRVVAPNWPIVQPASTGEIVDAGLTQVLAAGPELLRRWEHAPDPYVKAVISFAADARRLGVLSPIAEDAFESAIGGYLTSSQRVNRPPRWLADALADLLQSHLAEVPDDRSAADRLDHIAALAQRIKGMRAASAGGDFEADHRLAEMFVDGGEADALRVRADAGSLLAEEDLATLLADRGAVDELRERANRGKQPAADSLAELLATHGRVDALWQRANAGDQAASRQVANLLASETTLDGAAVQAQLGLLRRRIGSGDEVAARQLTALLFDLRNVAELRREVDAGTLEAAERLVALLNSDETVDRAYVDRLRTYGLDAGGAPYGPREA